MRVARPGQAGISGWTVGGTGDGHDTHGHSVQTFGKDRVPALFYPRIEADPATRAPGNGPANRSAPPARGFDRRAGGRHRRPSRLRQDDAPGPVGRPGPTDVRVAIDRRARQRSRGPADVHRGRARPGRASRPCGIPRAGFPRLAGRGERPAATRVRLGLQDAPARAGPGRRASPPERRVSGPDPGARRAPSRGVAACHRRPEGWPVALYLAALSLRMGDAEGDGIALGGDDRFFVDYLQSVLLSRLPPEVVAFLTRTSVLEHMSGPLCDAVLDRTGSADLLESLERSNLLLIPLDRRRR